MVGPALLETLARGGGADGRTRPRHRRFTEITFDIDPRFQKLCQEKPKTADK